jgi:hypothetical protein
MNGSFDAEAYGHNVEIVGYTDLQARSGFQIALHKADERWFLYTAALWHSGMTIVEVTNPADPRFIQFMPGPPNTWTLQVQIADGRMITSMERIPPGWGGALDQPHAEGFLIWDLADPESPQKIGHF